MTLPEFAIKRHVTTLMIIVSLVVLGGVALFRLPLAFLPDVVEPELFVSLPYPNASPEHRYAIISSEYTQKTHLFTSPDGIHFTKHPEQISSLHSDSQISTFWDKDVGKYFHYPRRCIPNTNDDNDWFRATGVVTTSRMDEPWPDPSSIPS